MTNRQKKIVMLSAILALTFGVTPVANAMHIMEGYLPGNRILLHQENTGCQFQTAPVGGNGRGLRIRNLILKDSVGDR